MFSQLGHDKDRFLADAREDLDYILQRVSENVANAIDTAIDSDIQKIGPDAYFVNKWRTLRPLYKQLAGNVADYCKMLLRLKDIECLVYARAKEVDSARRTLQRRIEWGDMHQQPIRTLKDMFSEMHDLSGTMIVVNQPKLDAVNRIIEEFFQEVGKQTDWEAPAQHISSLGNHRSYNHHVTLSKTKYHEAAKFEIQVVSYQTHTYSMVSHDWEYKGMHGPLEEKDKFVLEILKSTGCTYDLVSRYFEQKKSEISTSIGPHDLYFASQELNGPLPMDLTIEQASYSTEMNKSKNFWQQARDDITALTLALRHNTDLLQQFHSNNRVWGTAVAGNPYITTEAQTSSRVELKKPTTSRKSIRYLDRPEQYHTRRKHMTRWRSSSQANKDRTRNHFNDTLRASNRGDKLRATDTPATQLTTLQASDNKCTVVPERLHPKCTMSYADLPTDTLVRSVTSFEPLHYGRNWIFGTIMISTTVVSYKRDSRGNSDLKEKEEKLRSIKYIPPRWISSRGVVCSKTTVKWLNMPTQSDPIYRCRTINVVPGYSDIFQACENWEFTKIYDLFKTGKASPYDMDEYGRNVLGFLGVGPLYGSPWVEKILEGNSLDSDVSIIVKKTEVIEDFVKLVERLVEWGVDPSELELDEQTPFMILVSIWADLDTASRSQETMNYIFGFLLAKARSTPFVGADALVKVTSYGHYYNYQFPGSGCFAFPLSFKCVEFLVQQDQWPITWDTHQLCEMCSPYDRSDSARKIVQNWVLSTAHDAEFALRARLRLLETLLQAGIFNTPDTTEDDNWSRAFHTVVHNGGTILSVLTEHTYGSSGTLPCIRHRFRKSILVREWMVNTFTLLLRFCPVRFDEDEFFTQISNYSRQHNARTENAWIKAKNHYSTASAETISGSEFETKSRLPMIGANTDDPIEAEWETDCSSSPGSAWETDEEWEEGPLLDKARDLNPQDDKNMQKSYLHKCTCKSWERDFDEEYWSHVYHMFEENTQLDIEKAEDQQRYLGKIAKTTSTLLSYVV